MGKPGLWRIERERASEDANYVVRITFRVDADDLITLIWVNTLSIVSLIFNCQIYNF